MRASKIDQMNAFIKKTINSYSYICSWSHFDKHFFTWLTFLNTQFYLIVFSNGGTDLLEGIQREFNKRLLVTSTSVHNTSCNFWFEKNKYHHHNPDSKTRKKLFTTSVRFTPNYCVVEDALQSPLRLLKDGRTVRNPKRGLFPNRRAGQLGETPYTWGRRISAPENLSNRQESTSFRALELFHCLESSVDSDCCCVSDCIAATRKQTRNCNTPFKKTLLT